MGSSSIELVPATAFSKPSNTPGARLQPKLAQRSSLEFHLLLLLLLLPFLPPLLPLLLPEGARTRANPPHATFTNMGSTSILRLQRVVTERVSVTEHGQQSTLEEEPGLPTQAADLRLRNLSGEHLLHLTTTRLHLQPR